MKIDTTINPNKIIRKIKREIEIENKIREARACYVDGSGLNYFGTNFIWLKKYNKAFLCEHCGKRVQYCNITRHNKKYCI